MDRLRVRFSASSANNRPELVRVSLSCPRFGPRFRLRAISRILGTLALLLLISQPACLASSAGESQEDRLLRLREALHTAPQNADSGAAIQTLRGELRRTLRPPFALSLLAAGGLIAIAMIAVRCRIREQERLRSLRRLRQFSLFESTFPQRLSAELRGLLARLHGRSELLVERTQQSGGAALAEQGLRQDARRLAELLAATRRVADLGPALRIGSRAMVELGPIIAAAGGQPGGASDTLVLSNAKFLQLGLEVLLAAAAGLDEDPVHLTGRPSELASDRLPLPAPATIYVHLPEHDLVLLTLTSPHDLTRPGRTSGVTLGQRIILCLGGRLRITTEHQTGSQLEVELPLL